MPVFCPQVPKAGKSLSCRLQPNGRNHDTLPTVFLCCPEGQMRQELGAEHWRQRANVAIAGAILMLQKLFRFKRGKDTSLPSL